MSVLLTAANSDWLTGAQPISAYPFTANVWYKTLSTGIQQTPWCINQNADTNYLRGFLNSTNALQFQMNGSPAGTESAIISGPYVASRWDMLTCVGHSATDRRLFWNGSDRADATNNIGFGAPNNLAVGTFRRTTNTQFMNGYVAELAFWDTALSDSDVAALYASIATDPAFGLPVFYASFTTSITPEIGAPLSIGGGTPTIDPDHPPVSMPGTGVSWQAWRPGVLKPCWTTNNGQDLKASSTTSLYTGGDPTSPDQIKASIVRKLQ